jgi:hypothetical protein
MLVLLDGPNLSATACPPKPAAVLAGVGGACHAEARIESHAGVGGTMPSSAHANQHKPARSSNLSGVSSKDLSLGHKGAQDVASVIEGSCGRHHGCSCGAGVASHGANAGVSLAAGTWG